MNYHLHRISYEGRWAYPFLEKENLLSCGWGYFATSKYWPLNQEQNLDDVPNLIRKCWEEYRWETKRRRFGGLRNFLKMEQGDRVIVPARKEFHVYEVADNKTLVATEIKESLNNISLSNKKNGSKIYARIENRELWEYDEVQNKLGVVDLGFFRRVKKICKCRGISREHFADYTLNKDLGRGSQGTTRYKLPSASRASIEDAIVRVQNNHPISLREEVLEKCANDIQLLRTAVAEEREEALKRCTDKTLKEIKSRLTPTKFERLIKLFFECQGASARIPPKKRKGKKGDADIIANFSLRNLTIYVQAKHHQGETGEWAVEQIRKYSENKDNASSEDEITQAWVVSTADNFSEECVEEARNAKVRLINGHEFAKMLLDVGIEKLDI